MAFLDNSGDIILDAVLTDTGRMRLAKGDGSFRIAKFALGDDEIDYSLYNYSNTSGTAYYDLEVLQTPILEAFSNNASSMKSKLISIARNNLLYLPVIKVNTYTAAFNPAKTLVNNGYVLAVDLDTELYFNSGSVVKYDGVSVGPAGILFGNTMAGPNFIQLDQGQDTTQIIPSVGLDADLVETQYIIELDNRIASVMDTQGNVQTPSYIDDDDIATYYLSRDVDGTLVMTNTSVATVGTEQQVIAGPRGTMIKFKLLAKSDVSTSSYLFDTLGIDLTANFSGGTATNIRGILTNVRVTGVTTGNSLDIPIMVVKKIS